MKKTSLALLLATIVAVSFWAGTRYKQAPTPGTPASSGEREILYYTDPMNPGFRSQSPGIAPCGMPLEPVYADQDEVAGSPLPSGAVRVRTDRQQLIGVKTVSVEAQPMIYALRLYGKVVPDETRVFRVNASTDSWIRELSDVTTGSYVKKGQILAEALAPAFYNAQVTYLIALDNMDRIQEQLGGQLRHQQSDLANNQMRMAVQALQNLGIGDEQVEELANTRKARPYLQVRAPTKGFVLNRNITLNQWFKAGEEFYTIADLDKVWVYCDVYEDEARHLRPGMLVHVKHTQLGKTYNAKVSQVLPLFDPISKTLKVRVDLDNPQFDLRPDMFVDVEIPVSLPPAMHVSADALINMGMKTIVYVDMGDGVIEPREVETGWNLGRRVEIRGGLMPGERVVVSGNFLIDSESRMKTAASLSDIQESKDLVCGMMVSEATAEALGRTVEHEGHTYHFCSSDCMVKFLADMKTFLARADTEVMAGGEGAIDPVCGMGVDPLQAEYRGWFVTLDGETHHFCSQKCLNSFLQNPGDYPAVKAEKPMVPMKMPQHQAVSEPRENTSASQVMPAAQAMEQDRIDWTRSHNPVMRKRSDTPGVVDWDGPDKDPKAGESQNWAGWGKFPGSEYLGLNDKRKVRESVQPPASSPSADTGQLSPPAETTTQPQMQGHAGGQTSQ